MASSTFTPNLGIEQPATGMYANTWGTVANRSYAVIDAAIGGNAQIVISGAYTLTTAQGVEPSNGLYPLIQWTGSLTAQATVTIAPNTEQRLYIMSNQTSGGFSIAFTQGAGSQFVLQPGYDAHIYCDGGGATANVAAAIANPQFNNVLVQGNLTLGGNLLGPTGGALNLGSALASSLGINVTPVNVVDPLTISGVGLGGQIRLVNGSNYSAILLNDGANFSIYPSVLGGPYGPAAATPWLSIALANGAVGLGGSLPSGLYALNTTTVSCTSLAVSGTVNCAQLYATGGINLDSAASNNGALIDLLFGLSSAGVGVGSGQAPGATNFGGLTFFAGTGRLYLTSAGRVGINFYPPDTAHALCVAGYIHTTAGIVFPDGSVQTTAVSGTFTQLTVNGNATISGSMTTNGPANFGGSLTTSGAYYGPGGRSPILYAYSRSSSVGVNMPANTVAIVEGPFGLEMWWGMYNGTIWYNNQILTQYWQQWTGPVQ